MNAKVDKQIIVGIKEPEKDSRAFVRLKVKPDDYFEFQEEALHQSKKKLTYQKSETSWRKWKAKPPGARRKHVRKPRWTTRRPKPKLRQHSPPPPPKRRRKKAGGE